MKKSKDLKTHLYAGELKLDPCIIYAACGLCFLSEIDKKYVKKRRSSVKCENCKRTKLFRRKK